MDLMQKLGGRKFLMTLIVLGVAVFLEMHSEKGLTTTMAGFMLAIVGTFSVVNFASTNTFMKNKPTATGDNSLHKKIDTLAKAVDTGFSPERTENLAKLLANINNGLTQVQTVAGQVAQAVVNQNSVIQNLKNRG